MTPSSRARSAQKTTDPVITAVAPWLTHEAGIVVGGRF